MDLNVAADQCAWTVRIGRSPDTERVRRAGLAAVVHLDAEGLGGRAGGPSHGGGTAERGMGACTTSAGADREVINGLRFYAYVGAVVFVLEVPTRRAALCHKTEGGFAIGIAHAGKQRRD